MVRAGLALKDEAPLSITPLLRSASARSVGVTFGLQLPDASDHINHAGNKGEDSRHDHDEPQRQKSQLQHHPCDRAHLTNGRNLARPTWFHPHFVADEIMQDGRADQNDSVAGMTRTGNHTGNFP